MRLAEAAGFGHFFYGEILGIVGFYVLEDKLGFVQSPVFGGARGELHLYGVGKQDIKELEQLGLYRELIGKRPVFAQFIRSIQTGCGFPVEFPACGEVGGNFHMALHKGEKVIGDADVFLAEKNHVCLKNNIFVFHGLFRRLVDGMELSGDNHQNVAG